MATEQTVRRKSKERQIRDAGPAELPEIETDEDDFLDLDKDAIPPRRSSRHHRVSSAPGILDYVAAGGGDSSRVPQQALPQQMYPFHLRTYMPDIEQGDEVARALKDFEKHFLSDDTSVTVIQSDAGGRNREEEIWDYSNIVDATYGSLASAQAKAYRFFFINRYLVKDSSQKAPKDAKRFRISPAAFRALLSYYEIPPAFVQDVVHYYQLGGRGTRLHTQGPHNGLTYDLWYMIPLRVQFDCTTKGGHSGTNQMNPFHYLHLPDAKLDIRGSQIGVFFQYNIQSKSTAVVSINFQDGRWNKLVEGVQNRVKEAMAHNESVNIDSDPFFVHLIYMSSITRWWNNSLRSFNEQLIEHEKSLQNQIERHDTNIDAVAEFNNEMNKSLHYMSAHLHRFSSEILLLEETTQYIISEHQNFFATVMKPRAVTFQKQRPSDYIDDEDRVKRGLQNILSQVKSIEKFRLELLHKNENILALLFNNMSVSNDRAQVKNGFKMQEILKATQEETRISQRMAKASQKLTEEMKKDSISMKTIAIVTMVFLPGATFAALLAMPFFTEANNSFLNNTNNVWLWILLTVPATLGCFCFYYWKRRQDMKNTQRMDKEDEEFGIGSRINSRKPTALTQ